MLIRFICLSSILSSCITGRNEGLNAKDVQETIVARYPRIQQCYIQGVGGEGYAGVVKASFTIDKDGKAKSVQLIDESLGTQKVDACLKAEILAMTFPKPRGGVDVAVSYPFKFEADKNLTKAAVIDVLKVVDTSLCYDEIAMAGDLKVRLRIGRQGRAEDARLVFDETELKEQSPCLDRMLRKQKFPKIASKQFRSVSVVVTFQADEDEARRLSENPWWEGASKDAR